MLDLYADWCVACKEFEHKTFVDPQVQTALKEVLLLRVDMTNNSESIPHFEESTGRDRLAYHHFL